MENIMKNYVLRNTVWEIKSGGEKWVQVWNGIDMEKGVWLEILSQFNSI